MMRAKMTALFAVLWLTFPPAPPARAQGGLQEFLNALMRGHRGAVIISNPSTGEIRAVWNAAVAFNQAFPPGSTAKLVESAALLEERKISSTDQVHCLRIPELLGESFHCVHPFVASPMDLKSALAFSCNYFFVGMSVRLSSRSLAHWYNVFGFGTAVEAVGSSRNPGRVHIPDDAPGKARAALGEGTVLATPAQLLLAYSAVANSGKVFRLHTRAHGDAKQAQPHRELKLSPETFADLNAGLEQCVTVGTCQAAAVPGVRVAGKTGTATALDGSRTTHAWFAGYAPAEAPEIALVVFLERGTGARDAAPLASRILGHYFALKNRRP